MANDLTPSKSLVDFTRDLCYGIVRLPLIKQGEQPTICFVPAGALSAPLSTVQQGGGAFFHSEEVNWNDFWWEGNIMSDDLRKEIYYSMNLKETDELIEIWRKNDHSEWSDQAFDVVQEILLNRLGEVPLQAEPIYEKSEPNPNSQALTQRMEKTLLNLLIIPAVMLLFYLVPILIGALYQLSHDWEKIPPPPAKPQKLLGNSGFGHLIVLAEDETVYEFRLETDEWSVGTLTNAPNNNACELATLKFLAGKRPFSKPFDCVQDQYNQGDSPPIRYSIALDQNGTLWLWERYYMLSDIEAICHSYLCLAIGFIIGFIIFIIRSRKRKEGNTPSADEPA